MQGADIADMFRVSGTPRYDIAMSLDTSVISIVAFVLDPSQPANIT